MIPFPKYCISKIETCYHYFWYNANTDEDANDDQIDEPDFGLNQDTVFELVEPGTFVGM